MVVMEDGIAKRSDYRRFKVKTLDNQDDFASMDEVLTRRFRNYLRERDEGAHAGKRFAYPPNLLVVDGGKGQLNVAVRVLEELGLEDICVASLAKRFEEVYLPGPERAGADPARLRGALPAAAGARRGAPLRDHVPPPAARQEDDRVGDRRRRRPRARAASSGCCKEVGSVKKLRELAEEDLHALTWLPDAVGTAVYRRLHGLDTPDSHAVAARLRRDDGRRMTHPAADETPLDVTIITGMSGAGRSEAAHVLEDLGFFVIDNLPPMLIGKVAELARGHDTPTRYALVVDVRSGDFLHDLSAAIDELHQQGVTTRILYLDAGDDVLVRRYEESRRRHPLSDSDRVSDGIARERALLEPLVAEADLRVDTSTLNVHELRDRLRELFSEHESDGDAAGQRRVVRLQARAPARRRPRVRLPLPAEPALGRRAPAAHRARRTASATTCSPSAATREFLDELDRLFGLLLPGYEREGKAYLSIAFGCTGGRHRSVVIAEQLAERLRRRGHRTAVHHRDVERAG